MIPTHWLPFVLASRLQNWSTSKTLSILLIAASGHIIMTTLLGAAIFSLGLGVFHQIEKYFLLISSGSIASYGLFQIYRYKTGHKHSHCDHTHHHNHTEEMKLQSRDGWAILSLLALLTFSPCESFLPVYLSAVSFGWQGFVILSITLAIGTIGTMVGFTYLSSKTVGKMKLDWLADHEYLITGIGLIFLALLLFFIESRHFIN